MPNYVPPYMMPTVPVGRKAIYVPPPMGTVPLGRGVTPPVPNSYRPVNSNVSISQNFPDLNSFPIYTSFL